MCLCVALFQFRSGWCYFGCYYFVVAVKRCRDFNMKQILLFVCCFFSLYISIIHTIKTTKLYSGKKLSRIRSCSSTLTSRVLHVRSNSLFCLPSCCIFCNTVRFTTEIELECRLVSQFLFQLIGNNTQQNNICMRQEQNRSCESVCVYTCVHGKYFDSQWY